MVTVSVVVATLNRQKVVQNTVRMLAVQDYPDCEFVVVDQTKDRDLELERAIAQLGSRFRYIRLLKPNLPAARNAGIRNTVGDIILFIDDDVSPDKDIVSLHARAHQEGRNVGAVTGLFLDTDRPLEESLEWCRKAYEVPDVKSGGVFEVSWAIGGNMSYRRRALMEAGMFDEYFRGCALGEDIDTSEMVRLKGYKILLDCRIQLRHLHLSNGGCEVRNPVEEQRVFDENFEMTIYRLMKRLAMKPSFNFALMALISLRRYMLTRSLLRQGIKAVIRRESEAVRIIARASKAVFETVWKLGRHEVRS